MSQLKHDNLAKSIAEFAAIYTAANDYGKGFLEGVLYGLKADNKAQQPDDSSKESA